MKRTKKPSAAQEFIDVFADVIADRVAAKLRATEPMLMPDKVPVWLAGPQRPRGQRRPPIEGKWTVEKAIRNAGMLTRGDPGYAEALKSYLEAWRKHEEELQRRARTRRAVKLFEKLMKSVTPRK